MWFKQTTKSSQEWLFPWGKGSEEVKKQPETAIAINCFSSLIFPTYSFSLLTKGHCTHGAGQLRWFGDRHYCLCCVGNETFKPISLIQKDAAVSRDLFDFPWDAGGVDSKPPQCLYAEKPFNTTTGRFIAPLPLLLALTHGAVSDLGQAPAAVSVDLIEGFVLPLTLTPKEDLNSF